MENYRLKWTRTWDDVPEDYVGHDPKTGERVGRIHQEPGAPRGTPRWGWFGQGEIGKSVFSERGREFTKQEAADALTKAWHRANAKSSPNAYAKSKGE